MISGFASLYMPSFAKSIVYMLQSSEYRVGDYLRWFWRTKNYSTVMNRRSLDMTKPARLLLMAVRIGIFAQITLALFVAYLGIYHGLFGGVTYAAAIFLAYPLVWAHTIVLPLLAGKFLISRPAERKLVAASKTIFANHLGIKIAVAGSYGKTTMKDLLVTVLAQGLDVAATPANKNVAISHAYFARKLTGKEDVVILEYGEGAPGDVFAFAKTTSPTHAIVTGLAPAHLDSYGSMIAAAKDIMSVANFVPHSQLFMNTESPYIKNYLIPDAQAFDHKGALGFKVENVETSLRGTTFTITKGKQKLALRSDLVGKHQVSFLAFVAAFGLKLGLTTDQVKAGIAATKPYEHRMQPYQLGGAWVIDDTYNGNIEGIRAGTQLLADLDAKRKIYVTPGLVDQGNESYAVHNEMGKLIAAAKPDIVVLMQNSVTEYIQSGLGEAGFAGELQVQADPLTFYTNLNHFVASGDLVVMQNDWTDNYH